LVAIGALWFSIIVTNQDLLSKSIGIFGGIYIIVRGFDNIDKVLPRRFRQKWDAIFKPRRDLAANANPRPASVSKNNAPIALGREH
jgi:hypothetical protein